METETIIKLPFLLENLLEVSKELGYETEIIDRNLMRISSGEKSFFAGANGDMGINPINPHFAAEMASDKARTLELLHRAGFRTPKSRHFFVSGNYREEGKEPGDALSFAEESGFPLFVKPNRGRGAKFADAVYSMDTLKQRLKDIARVESVALVQELLDMPEYRMVAVDGKFQYSCRKSRPVLKGDGEKTVAGLIRAFNEKLGETVISADSHYLSNQLSLRGLSRESVIGKGEAIPVSSISNLWTGGGVAEYSESVSLSTARWMERVAKVLNLRVLGLDVFSENGLENPDSIIILEANHNPGHKVAPKAKVKEIIKDICEKYFL